jgi:hypothetical protein
MMLLLGGFTRLLSFTSGSTSSDLPGWPTAVLHSYELLHFLLLAGNSAPNSTGADPKDKI